MALLDDAIEYIRLGNRDEGREILEELLEEDENSDEGWLWMSAVVEDDEERQICLENVIQLNPDNGVAQNALEAIEAGTFNLNDMLAEALEAHESFDDDEDEEGDEDDDDYELDDEDDDLEMPSTMQEKSGGLNMRLILLGIMGFLLVCGLGGVAAYNMMSGNLNPDNGGEERQEEQPAQNEEQPAEDSEAPAPAESEATATPIPTPTETPTPTNTPFQLPTAPPTEAPSPTPTQVVPPTPG